MTFDLPHMIVTALLITVGITNMTTAIAQDRIDIRFKSGATSTTINGTISGDDYIDYVLNARGGQKMVVSLEVTGTNGHGSAFFNFLPAGEDYGGPYIGRSDDDRRAEITVPSDGDWAIRVYLMGNDRETGKTVGYSIDIDIAPFTASSVTTPQPGAGSNIVRVKGVSGDDVLNVRSGPGTSSGIVAALGNGTQVRQLGCRIQGSARWCQIEMLTDMRERGWVNARFLTGVGLTANDGLQGTQAQFNRMVQPCITEASRTTGASRESIKILDQVRTASGPLLTLTARGNHYSCRLEGNGGVTVFSEFAN